MERVYKRESFIIYKLIPCLIVAMFSFMCLYGSYVCADFDVTYNNEIVSLPDLPELPTDTFLYTIAYDDYWHGYYLAFFSSSEDVSFYSSSDNSGAYNVYFSSPVFYQAYILRDSNPNVWSTFGNDSSCSNMGIGTLNTVCFSSVDIYDNDNNLVFQAPPQQVEGIIAKETQGVEMNKTLQEITGILPTVLVVIVGLIAIRKGIQFLTRLMKRQ